MTSYSGQELRNKLLQLGITDTAISAAWPRWWSEEANSSSSAKLELSFSVARHLGLDPHSLLDDDQPRFLWRDEARFKHMTAESEIEEAGITSFGRAIAAIVLAASPAPTHSAGLVGRSAEEIRAMVLEDRPYVEILDLLALAWGLGVPVIHLHVFPWPRKRMAAMTVRLGDRWVILLGRASRYPAPIAFYLAHELGHIANGDLAPNQSIVEYGDEDGLALDAVIADDEEVRADTFALTLLTGNPRPVVVPMDEDAFSGRELAEIAVRSAPELAIEAGFIAQCFGYSTGEWATTNNALRRIYDEQPAVWEMVNGAARAQLDATAAPEDALAFLDAVMTPTVE